MSGFIVFSTCSDGINNVRNAHTDCCLDILTSQNVLVQWEAPQANMLGDLLVDHLVR